MWISQFLLFVSSRTCSPGEIAWTLPNWHWWWLLGCFVNISITQRLGLLIARKERYSSLVYHSWQASKCCRLIVAKEDEEDKSILRRICLRHCEIFQADVDEDFRQRTKTKKDNFAIGYWVKNKSISIWAKKNVNFAMICSLSGYVTYISWQQIVIVLNISRWRRQKEEMWVSEWERRQIIATSNSSIHTRCQQLK